MELDKVISLYKSVTSHNPDSITAIKGSGSSRKYYRLEGNPSLITTIGTDVRENEAFIYLSNHFRKKGIAVPEVVAVTDDSGAYLQTDCGSVSLFERLNDMVLLEKAIKQLVMIQYEGAKGLDFRKCYPVEAFDRQSIMWDLNYFKYCFLKSTSTEFDEVKLENEFSKLADDLEVRDDENTFMFRDFQSRNVIVDSDDNVHLIDFQGGRRGPALYDLASFLYQARAGFSDLTRDHLIDRYIEYAAPFVTLNREQLVSRLKYYVLLRQLQTLGAYGYRGIIQNKSHFILSIPPALSNLRKLLNDGFPSFPYLKSLLQRMVDEYPESRIAESELTVKVNSFSFKQGIPRDLSGNGGGFVFDCRGLPNPGRYEEYRNFTGRDKNVISFLEKRAEVSEFIDHAFEMVAISVTTYLSRGFTSLMVNFGCTGGRHRSVYCAETLAHRLNKHFNVRVELSHVEQNISQTLEKR